jgi:DNA-binding NarL/FixJ family response regulator
VVSITPREREVLVALCRPAVTAELFVEPASVREMAQALEVTEAAVKQHLLKLYDKFGIHDGVERRRVTLAREALRRDVIGLPDLIEMPERVSGAR